MNILPQRLGEGWNFSSHVCVEQMNFGYSLFKWFATCFQIINIHLMQTTQEEY